MKSRITYEMNRVNLILTDEIIEITKDYRIKMIENNDIHGLIKQETRLIDGDVERYYDITDKESLFNFYIKKIVDRNDIIELFRSIKNMSEELKDVLIDEKNIILDPEYIFKNIRTGEYEFICVPRKDDYKSDELKILLQFVMTRIDSTDQNLVDAIFDIYNKTDTSVIKTSVIYGLLIESLMVLETENIEETEDIIIEEKQTDLKHIYIPSLAEVGAYGLCIIGIIIIGINLYKSFLL